MINIQEIADKYEQLWESYPMQMQNMVDEITNALTLREEEISGRLLDIEASMEIKTLDDLCALADAYDAVCDLRKEIEKM